MENELDILMQTELLSVPSDFTERVMNEIHLDLHATPREKLRKSFQWFALISGAVIGLFELVTFIFGIWTVTTAY